MLLSYSTVLLLFLPRFSTSRKLKRELYYRQRCWTSLWKDFYKGTAKFLVSVTSNKYLKMVSVHCYFTQLPILCHQHIKRCHFQKAYFCLHLYIAVSQHKWLLRSPQQIAPSQCMHCLYTMHPCFQIINASQGGF